MFSSEAPPEEPTPVSGDFWAGIVDYWVTNWDEVQRLAEGKPAG